MKRTVIDFINRLSADLFASGHYDRARTCDSALRSVLRFSGDGSLALSTLFSPAFLQGYELFLIRSGCVRNTTSYYMRVLKFVYKQAIRGGFARPVSDPFSGVFTGVGSTRKRALDPGVLALLFAGDLSGKPRLIPCRDYFLLSLLLQGMSFVDLAHLRKSDLRNNQLVYCRSKTGGSVGVAVLPAAQEIFDRYVSRVADSPYLLPLITLSGEAGHREYKSAIRRQNRQLKELASYLDIEESLSTYTARHSWATLAYHSGERLGVVSQGLGHHSEAVTGTYLAGFRQSDLLRANNRVLCSILLPVAQGKVKNVLPEVKTRAKRQVEEVMCSLNREAEVFHAGYPDAGTDGKPEVFQQWRQESSGSGPGGSFGKKGKYPPLW